ncbi:hypothetical protein BO94DRAFT_424974, partial [Aspergillus sclerotioniger CBS 115572]
WYADKSPHIMISCVHNSMGDNGTMQQGEVLAIVGAMVSSIFSRRFKASYNIPVLIFSFMGGRKARILQAHLNKEEILVRKRKLYDFSTEDAAYNSRDIFLRYMYCNRVGNT